MPLNPNSYGSASGWAMTPRGGGAVPPQPAQQPPPQQQPPQQQDWRQKLMAFMQSIGVPLPDMEKIALVMQPAQNPGLIKNAMPPTQPGQQQPNYKQGSISGMSPEQIQRILGNNP